MAKHQILEYTIWLRDAAKVLQVQQWIAAFGVGGTATIPGQLITQTNGVSLGIYKSPLQAGIDYDQYVGGDGAPPLPYVEVGGAVPGTGPGYITSGWFTQATNNFPRNQKTFQISTGWWIFGSTTIFYWAGKIALAPGAPIGVGTPSDQLPGQTFGRRYWLCGFEDTRDAEQGDVGGSGVPIVGRHCVAASRTGDGMGARHIAQNNAGQYERFFLPVVATEVWQRFYVRPLRYGSDTTRFWSVETSAGETFLLGLTTTGQLALFQQVGFTPPIALLSTFGQLTLGRWAKLDIFLHGDTAKLYSLEVRLNGVLVGSASLTSAFNQPTRRWVGGSLGLGVHADAAHTTINTDLEMDFDDWVGGAMPITQSIHIPAWDVAVAYVIGNVVRHASFTYVAVAASTGVAPTGTGTTPWALAGDATDIAEGSHIIRVAPSAFGPAHVAADWTGDVRMLMPRTRYLTASASVNALVTSTPGTVLEVTLPMADVVDTQPQSLGVAAFHVMVLSARASGANDPQVGYQIDSETPFTSTLNDEPNVGGAAVWATLTGPSTGRLLPKGTTLRLRYVKGGDAVESRVSALAATVELLGSFGPEDRPAGDTMTFPVPVPVHQNPWPSSPWAHDLNPLGPCLIIGGTYVGTGTGQDLLLPLPPAFLLIRVAAQTAHSVARWWPSLIAAHTAHEEAFDTDLAVMHTDRDPTFVPSAPDADQQLQYRVRLGASATSNAVGVTYQYCALLDPAGRFSRAFGTTARPTGSMGVAGLPRTWPLDDATFIPEVGYVFGERSPSVSDVSPAFLWKHAGHTGDAASEMTTTSVSVADALTFGTGALTLRAGLVDDNAEQYAAILFRRTDGNPEADGRVVFTGSYTGDGAASRTITFGSTGRRPFYAHVGPAAGGIHHHRDPSHLSTTSSHLTLQPGTGTWTDGITAGGPDSFTVGSALNTNGLTYGYWGLYGSLEAGNNGWSTNGTFVPVPSDSTQPPGWVNPVLGPEPPEGPGGGGGGGGTGPGGCGDDCAEGCVAWSTHLVNLGLSSIGITDAVTDLGEDVSRQAGTARLHYRLEIDAVLRAYPWKFATRYAQLELEDGDPDDPDNPDWVYRYALPDDCLLVRRIVPPRPSTDPLAPRAFSHAAIPFAYMESDESDPFLVTDAADVTIEYTARPACPGKVRDAIFKRACTWRLAHAFAAPLGRDKEQLQQAYTLYEQQIQLAQARDTAEQQPLVPSGRYLDPGGLTTDCAEGCVDYSTHLANLALSSLGMPETITSLKTDPSGPAMLARLHFKAEIDAVLRAHPWKFATRYATLLTWAEMDPPVDPDPDEVLTNPEWAHQYVLPADVLLVRRVVHALPADHVAGTAVPDYQRQFTETTVPFDYMESNSGTSYLMSNAVPVTIEYTARVPCPAKARDPLFIRACAWRLAHAMAAPLKVDKAISAQAYQLYLLQLDEARSRDQNEQSPQNPVHIGEAEWIRGRE